MTTLIQKGFFTNFDKCSSTSFKLAFSIVEYPLWLRFTFTRALKLQSTLAPSGTDVTAIDSTVAPVKFPRVSPVAKLRVISPDMMSLPQLVQVLVRHVGPQYPAENSHMNRITRKPVSGVSCTSLILGQTTGLYRRSKSFARALTS